MPRAPASSLFLVLLALLSGFLGAPQARAAEQATAEAADAPASPAATSPWEHPLWHDATAMMRIYLCDHARRPPTWCAEPRQLPANVELPEPQGPPLHDEDKRWLAFLEQADPANLSPAEVTTIRRRALERRDPQAMEILGFLYDSSQPDRDRAAAALALGIMGDRNPIAGTASPFWPARRGSAPTWMSSGSSSSATTWRARWP